MREQRCSGTANRRKACLDRSLGAATCWIGMYKEGLNAAKPAALVFVKLFCEPEGRIFRRVLQVCTTRSWSKWLKATSGLMNEISLKKGPPMKKFTVVLAALLTAAALGACAGKAPGKGKGKAPAAVAAPIAVRG